jgi:hypothetical protein
MEAILGALSDTELGMVILGVFLIIAFLIEFFTDK